MKKLWSNYIINLIKSSTKISHKYNPIQTIIRKIDNGVIYTKTDMDTDADGSPRATKIDKTGQLETSLRRSNGWKGNSQYVNAETIPYFVLPGNFGSVSGISCKLGDLALIRWKDNEIFAIYADVGNNINIGEGSIMLVESLGENPWNSSRTKIITGIDFGVEFLIFPQSNKNNFIPSTFEEIQKNGLEVFSKSFKPNTPYNVIVDSENQLFEVNVYTDINKLDPVIGKITTKELITVIENNGEGWLLVSSPFYGWIEENLITYLDTTD